jgi:hypothetical protein
MLFPTTAGVGIDLDAPAIALAAASLEGGTLVVVVAPSTSIAAVS